MLGINITHKDMGFNVIKTETRRFLFTEEINGRKKIISCNRGGKSQMANLMIDWPFAPI